VAATWARDRVDALSDEATTAEGHDLDLALRLWQRVLCLDPENIAAADALERSAALPGPVLTPGAAVAEAPAPGPGGLPPVSAAPPAAVAAAAEPLSSGWPFTLEVLPPYSPPPDPVRGDLAVLGEVDQELSEIRQLTEEAHFRTALAVARATGELLDRAGEGPAVDVRRARLELLSATAAVALGRDDEARTHMMAALAHDPTLTLDAGSTSPKVLALLREVRSETAQRPTAPAIAGAEGRP
jgi:hypothetical protein